MFAHPCGKLFIVISHLEQTICCYDPHLLQAVIVLTCVATVRCVDYRHVHLWRSVLAVVVQPCGKLFPDIGHLCGQVYLALIMHTCMQAREVHPYDDCHGYVFKKLSVAHTGSGSFQL